jgi:FkbM family methyltransferase
MKLCRYKRDKFYVTGDHDIKTFTSVIKGQYSIPECHVKKNDIVLDCGAHIGSFSYVASPQAASIFAFEPVPRTYFVLKKNIKLWKAKNITPVLKAIYLNKKDHNFFVDIMRTDGSTLLRKRARDLLSQPKLIKVKCTFIDDFVKEKKLERVDFIKMDIEGVEVEALRGAKNTIQKFKPRMSIAAYHFREDKTRIPRSVLSIR